MSSRIADDVLVSRLASVLGPALVDRGGAVPDPRLDEHVSGRSIGAPLAIVRPSTTTQVAEVVRIVRESGRHVVVVGAATTFWDGLHVDGAVVVDALALRERFEIDPDSRMAHVSAGYSVRQVDRAARAHGLVVASRPDSSGETPVGSVLAVASTAGLGMGFGAAVDQITGATAVVGTGEVVRLGASHALHGKPFEARGLPDVLGVLAAAEGRAAIVTDVGIRLRKAPFVAFVDATSASSAPPTVDALVGWLRIARDALDRSCLDTFRIEVGRDAGRPESRTTVSVRVFSDESPDRAQAQARAMASALAGNGLLAPNVRVESEAARVGVDPDYEVHWSMREGELRPRLRGAAFWGSEIATPWGADLPAALAHALELFDALAVVEPLHRRFAVYPASHQLSIGVQVLTPRSPALVERTRRLLDSANARLLPFGVPYRRGFLWTERLSELSADPARDASRELVERVLRAFDPDRVIGPRARGDAAVVPEPA